MARGINGHCVKIESDNGVLVAKMPNGTRIPFVREINISQNVDDANNGIAEITIKVIGEVKG